MTSDLNGMTSGLIGKILSGRVDENFSARLKDQRAHPISLMRRKGRTPKLLFGRPWAASHGLKPQGFLTLRKPRVNRPGMLSLWKIGYTAVIYQPQIFSNCAYP
jgi:hypothetical protein